MCDVIKIRLKRRIATRSKIEWKLHLKFGNHCFKIGSSTAVLICSGWFPFPLLIAIFLFNGIFMTSHMPLSSASIFLALKNSCNILQIVKWARKKWWTPTCSTVASVATSSTSISFSSTGRVVATTTTAEAWVVATAGASVANTVVDSTILMGAEKLHIFYYLIIVKIASVSLRVLKKITYLWYLYIWLG